jgi:uncharacterized RDD family membrane protein YckC
MTAATEAATRPVAELERRFHAFVLDRLLAWSVVGLLAWATYHFLVVVGGLLLVELGLAVVAGLAGTSPGKGLFGLQVVHAATGAPIGVGAAVLRSLILGIATLPTLGLGATVLAWTAVTDPGRLRRGWHDRIAGSVVVDARPAPEAPTVEDDPPRPIVNLTAMRLVPTAETSYGPVIRDCGIDPIGRWRVSFDTGECFVVDGLTLVGRCPEARPGERVRHIVPLRSEELSLSKTHAQLQVAPDGLLVVMDRGSTNGTVLIRSGVPKDLPAGKPTTLLPGDEVAFGDRRMTVAREP